MPDANRREVAEGSAWTALSWAVNVVTGPMVAVLLVRSMSHRQYGALALATDAVGLAAASLAFGLGPALTQIAVTERARSGVPGERAAIGQAARLSIIATAASLPCLAVIATIFLLDTYLHPALSTLLVMTPIVLFAPVTSILIGAHRALRWPRLLAYALVASSAATASAIIGLIIAGSPSSVTVGAGLDVRPVVTVLLLVWPLSRWWRSRHTSNGSDGPRIKVRRFVSLAVGFALAMTFGTVVSQLDVVVLGAFHGARVTGLYSPASAVANFLISVPLVIAAFYVPVVTRLVAQGDHGPVADLYHWATRFSIAFAAPLLAVVLVCPGALLAVIFGHSFSVEATPLRILGIGLLIYVLAGFNGITLDAHGLARVITYRLLIALVISIIACLLLIPLLGAIGAAAATTIGLFADNVISSSTLFHRYHLTPWDWRVGVVAAAFGASLIVTFFLGSTIADNFERCAVTAACAGVITLAAAITSEEKQERMWMRRAIASRLNPFDKQKYGV
ncbi:MAG: oligosaccharide flippase family protein [Acidimicrobiales bacterium]